MRAEIAFNAPPYVEPSLPNTCLSISTKCRARWEVEWWHGIAKMLMHPDQPMSIAELFDRLGNIALNIDGMCRFCSDVTVQAVLANTEIRDAEKELIGAALEAVRTEVTGRRIERSVQIH